jgi:hypothetical protein
MLLMILLMPKELSEKSSCYVNSLNVSVYRLGYFDHENVIALVDVIKPEARTGYNDIYIVTDLMETDLHRVIYSRQVTFIKNIVIGLGPF